MKTIYAGLACLFFLLPAFLKAGAVNNFPASSEKIADSILQEEIITQNTLQPAPEKIFSNPDNKVAGPDDWKKNGLFRALFHVGINFAQIDGDAYAGYDKIGLDAGGGVLVRFHKYFSTSMELGYTQYGARASLFPTINKYDANLNYIQVPLAINVHDKDIIMFSAGMNFSVLVAYYERNEISVNITDTVQPQPKKFDLDAFAEVHFIIKKQFCIGAKFSYSMIPFRGVEPAYATLTSIHGEYNNVLTIRFMYILGAIKKKQH